MTLAVVGAMITVDIITNNTLFERNMEWRDIAVLAISFGAVFSLVTKLIEKCGVKARINEIEEILLQHGFNLSDEMNKGKGR